MRRVIPAVVALATVLSAGLSPVTTANAAAPTTSVAPAQPSTQVAAKRLIKTPYIFGAAGFGTLVKGGAVPGGSSQTAYTVMGCNRFAGKDRSNFITSIAVPGLGSIDGVITHVTSKKKGSTYSAVSVNKIAGITLIDTPLGKLKIGAITSRSESFHKEGKYGAKASVEIASIRYTPPVGPVVNLPIPVPGTPVVVPGVLEISIGASTTEKGSDFAFATARGLKIRVIPTNTLVTVGRTKASLELNKTRGIFNGYGVGLQGDLLEGTAQIGRTAFQPLPCVGTDGEKRVKRLASADLSPLAVLGVTAGSAKAHWTKHGPVAHTVGYATDVKLLGDQIQIKAVYGVANVRRNKAGKLFTDTKGTKVGKITAGGQSYSLDQLGNLEIPGVAKLKAGIVEKTKTGITVIGLRVKLLDGSLGVFDIGVAKAKIRPTKKS